MFNPTYIELSDYSMFGRGDFLNDSTFNLTEISYLPMEDNPNKDVKDSSLTQIRINYKGVIHKEIITSSKDTIITKE